MHAVRVKFPPPKHSPVFWIPYGVLAASTGSEQLPWPLSFLQHDLGWLGVYLLAYLPAMFLSRLLFRIP